MRWRQQGSSEWRTNAVPLTTSQLSYEFDGLSESFTRSARSQSDTTTVYEIEVRALRDAEAGPWSPTQQLTNPNPTPLDKPTDLTLTGTRLCWNDVPNAADYGIEPNTVRIATTPISEGNNRLCAQLSGVMVGNVLRLIAYSGDNPKYSNSAWE